MYLTPSRPDTFAAFHARVQPDQEERAVHDQTTERRETDAGDAGGDPDTASEADQPPPWRNREVAAEGLSRLVELPRRAGQLQTPAELPRRGDSLVVVRSPPPEPAWPIVDRGPGASSREACPAASTDPASLSRPEISPDSRQGPYEAIPHVRIRAGGRRQRWFLPRLHSSSLGSLAPHPLNILQQEVHPNSQAPGSFIRSNAPVVRPTADRPVISAASSRKCSPEREQPPLLSALCVRRC